MQIRNPHPYKPKGAAPAPTPASYRMSFLNDILCIDHRDMEILRSTRLLSLSGTICYCISRVVAFWGEKREKRMLHPPFGRERVTDPLLCKGAGFDFGQVAIF